MYVLQMVFITILIMHKSFFVFLQSSGTILEYLQLKYSSIGILMEFKNGSHGLAYHELLRNRVSALPEMAVFSLYFRNVVLVVLGWIRH